MFCTGDIFSNFNVLAKLFFLKVTRIEDSIEDFQQLLKQFGLDSKDHSSPGTGRVVFWAEWACLAKGAYRCHQWFLS